MTKNTITSMTTIDILLWTLILGGEKETILPSLWKKTYSLVEI